MAKRYHIDNGLDQQIEVILQQWRQAGFSNVSRTDIIRLLVRKYHDEGQITPFRPPKKRDWKL